MIVYILKNYDSGREGDVVNDFVQPASDRHNQKPFGNPKIYTYIKYASQFLSVASQYMSRRRVVAVET